MDSTTMNKVVGAFVMVLWPFAAYHTLHSLMRGRVHAAAPADDKAVIAAFSRRRQVFQRAMSVALAGFAYAFLVIMYRHSEVLGIPVVIHFYIAFAIIGAGIATGSLVYRCPACGSPPWARMGDGSLGVSLNPDRCPTCGTRLRQA